MTKVLAVDYDKCTGCRTCEIVCSLQHNGEISPLKSRIRVVRWDDRGEAAQRSHRRLYLHHETVPSRGR